MMKAPPKLTEKEIDALEPSFFGPTWMREPDGSWKLPEHTLGWQIAGWCAEYLKAEDGGPWRFTREQLRWVLWWYAVDENGRFIYRKGVLQRLKGWGKDPLLAVVSLVEFVGPSRFSHWQDGQPVGIPHPQAWVQIAAVSRDQTRNTMTVMPGLMSDKLIETYGIKAGAELIRANGGRQRLEAVTSSYRALEGARSLAVHVCRSQRNAPLGRGQQRRQDVRHDRRQRDQEGLALPGDHERLPPR